MMNKRFSAVIAGVVLLSSPMAFADFLVVDKSLLKSPETAVKSHDGQAGKVINGYGKDVKFSDLLSEIVPADWFVSTAPGMGDEVIDWEGGLTWQPLVRKIAKDNNWDVTADHKNKVLSLTEGKAVASAKPATATVASKPAASNEVATVSTDGYKAAEKPVVNNFDVVTGSLEDRISVNLRDKSLKEVMRVLAPQGWAVDLQVPPYMSETKIDFTAETTRKQALAEVLSPMGLTALHYPNMSPAPLLVVIKGAK